ncbi:MAG: hypothetical protein AB1540_11875 [Bdellovibrionota bacterium]
MQYRFVSNLCFVLAAALLMSACGPEDNSEHHGRLNSNEQKSSGRSTPSEEVIEAASYAKELAELADESSKQAAGLVPPSDELPDVHYDHGCLLSKKTLDLLDKRKSVGAEQKVINIFQSTEADCLVRGIGSCIDQAKDVLQTMKIAARQLESSCVQSQTKGEVFLAQLIQSMVDYRKSVGLSAVELPASLFEQKDIAIAAGSDSAQNQGETAGEKIHVNHKTQMCEAPQGSANMCEDKNSKESAASVSSESLICTAPETVSDSTGGLEVHTMQDDQKIEWCESGNQR